MNNIKDKLKGGLIFLILILLLGGCFYLIDTHQDKTPPPKNTNWCAEIVYFNPKSKTIDTTYSPAVLYDDSIVNFKSPTGQIWRSKDFINREDNNVDYGTMSDITVSDGEHFKVTPISATGCLVKAVMDSLKDENIPEDNTYDNN